MFSILELERKNKKLTTIPLSIYRDVADHIKDYKDVPDDLSGAIPETAMTKERELLLNISEKILKIRINKTLTNPEESVGHLLTPEEKYILEPLLSGSRRNIKLLRAINDGHIEFLTGLEEHDVNPYIAVKFLEDTPSTVGIDSRTYGPYKEDDIAILPTDNAKPLLIQKKVQELNVDL